LCFVLNNNFYLIYILNKNEKERMANVLTNTKSGIRNFTVNNHDELLIFNEENNSLDVAGINSPGISQSPMPFSVKTEIDTYSRLFNYDDTTLAVTGKVGGFYLLHYNQNSKKYSCDGKRYFTDKFCTFIFRDRDGRAWIGTNDGLYKEKLSYHFFASTDLSSQIPELINHEISAINIKGNKLFVGLRQEGGLLLMDKGSGKIKLLSRGKTIRDIQARLPTTFSTLFVNA